MSVRDIPDPKVYYSRDEQGNEYLTVDVRGLELEKGECLWVWVYKPKPIAGQEGFSCRYADTKDCTPNNSIRVELAGKLKHKRGDKQDTERIWVPLQVPDTDLGDTQYLRVWTEYLDVPGWGWSPPSAR